DQKLREQGSSIAAQQRDFADQMLAFVFRKGKIDPKPKVTYAEINEYYEENKAAYQHEARAKWEQLTVLFSRFPSREAARAAITEMFNEARFGGSVAAVARAKSQEPFASDGGFHDWTSQGVLASEVLDRQVFTIPLGGLSPIIEDEQGYHVIRVLEREPAGVSSRAEVQDEIEGILRKQKIAKASREVMKELRDRVPVWSIFPKDVPGAQPMPGVTLVR
ncbi:MAG: peptidylprolyl isomerase, partial [Planctomycetota bacterium]